MGLTEKSEAISIIRSETLRKVENALSKTNRGTTDAQECFCIAVTLMHSEIYITDSAVVMRVEG
jgi:ArsR family metal-binding transcriptional regulator